MRAIPKIRTFKYGELHIDLSEQLKAVEDDLTAGSSEPDSSPQAPPSPDVVRIAEASPSAAMIFAWKKVEAAVHDAGLRHGLKIVERKSTHSSFKFLALERQGLMDDLTVSTFRQLRELRNRVVHSSAHRGGDVEASLEMLYQWHSHVSG